LLELPTLTEPEPVSELELELLLVVPLVVPLVVLVDVVAELWAWATAVTAMVPPTPSATSAPVAAATRRRPWSLRFCAFMASPSAPALCG
jgi:hypothetical protein